MGGISSDRAFNPRDVWRVRGAGSGHLDLTCERHQTQWAQISLGLENAGKTSLVAAGVYQAPPLGSVSKSRYNPLAGQSGLYFIKLWKYSAHWDF